MLIKSVFILISLVYPFGNQSASKPDTHLAKNAAKAGENACPKPMENLIMVNFTTKKLIVYINGKKLGNVPKENQKNFKKSLPVGTVNIKVQTSSKELIHEEDYSVIDAAKQTCKKNKAIVLR